MASRPCRCSLAGVSRSTTMVVAYLMTVTHYGWEECLSAVKAVRSFVGPNYGFQQQLQEYQTTRVAEVKKKNKKPPKLQLEIRQQSQILVSVFLPLTVLDRGSRV